MQLISYIIRYFYLTKRTNFHTKGKENGEKWDLSVKMKKNGY